MIFTYFNIFRLSFMIVTRYVCCSSWEATEKEWRDAIGRVGAVEGERIHRFVFCQDAKMAVMGRLLLGGVAVELMAARFDSGAPFRFGRNARGKPEVVEPSWFHASCALNISHHADHVVAVGVAAAEDTTGGMLPSTLRVGVDLVDVDEVQRGVATLEELFAQLHNVFTSHEWTQIRAGDSEDEQRRLFYKFWAHKEAYIKAIGKGLSQPLESLSFTICNGHKTTLRVDGQATSDEWHFSWSHVTGSLFAAVGWTGVHESRLCVPRWECVAPHAAIAQCPAVSGDTVFPPQLDQWCECFVSKMRMRRKDVT